MKLNENKDHIAKMLKDTIITFCKNIVSFNVVLKVEGFIVLTCDDENVLVVKIDDNQRGNSDQSQIRNASLRSDSTCKPYTLNNRNRMINPTQPLALQYSNWNTGMSNVSNTYILRQPRAPRARPKAPQQKKNILQPRGMGLGQRMGMIRPRMNAPKVAARMANIRQRFPSSGPRNVMHPCSPTQTMSMVPLTNFTHRMPSSTFSRQPVPTPNRQLAIQYIPGKMNASSAIGQDFAICDVASNEVVETTTSPLQYADESREQMFRDVVSNALDKLDKHCELSCSISENVPKSLGVSEGIVIPVQPSQVTPPSYDRVVNSNICKRIETKSPDDTMMSQTTQNKLCLPFNVGNTIQQTIHNTYFNNGVDAVSQDIASRVCHQNQVVNSFEQITACVGNSSNLIQSKPSSQLQISLVTMSKSSHWNPPILPISYQPGAIQNHNLSSLPTKPQKLATVDHMVKQHSETSMIWPSNVARESLYGSPQAGHSTSFLHPQMNSAVQWHGNSSQNVTRMHQASTFSDELKKQLHNIFEQQVKSQLSENSVPGRQNAFSHSQQCIQTSCTSPLKNNPYSPISCSSTLKNNPFGTVNCFIPKSISSQNPVRHSVTFSVATNPHFNYGISQANFVNNKSNLGQMFSHQANWMPNVHRGTPERNIFNQFCKENNLCQSEKLLSNSVTQNIANLAILPNSFNKSSTFPNANAVQQSGQTLVQNDKQMDLLQLNSPFVEFQVSRDSSINNQIRNKFNQEISSPLSFHCGSVISLNSTCISSSAPSLRPLLYSDSHFSLAKKATSLESVTFSNTNSSVVPSNSFLSTPMCLPETMKNTNFALDVIDNANQKRLPPLRLKNLGHGNLMVIESNQKEAECKIPQKKDELEVIVMGQVLMAVEGLREDSFKKELRQSDSDERIRNEHDLDTLNTTAHGDNVINQDLSYADYTDKIDISLNATCDNLSQIIRDVRLGSVGDIYNQNSFNDDDLTPGNVTLDYEIPGETFGVFDVCRNEVVTTRSRNGDESPSNEQLSDLSDKTLDTPVNILEDALSIYKQKEIISESYSAREETMDFKLQMGSDDYPQLQYTCLACQISMDSNIMLAEHYSNFHTSPKLHWIEHEVRPYLDRTYLTCPFNGCSKIFATSKQVISHYIKAHKNKMTYEQIMFIKKKEGSLVKCEYCNSQFPTKRLLKQHELESHFFLSG